MEHTVKTEVTNISTPANEAEYKHLMVDIEQLVKDGKGTIKNEDLDLYSKLAKAAADYESKAYISQNPKTQHL